MLFYIEEQGLGLLGGSLGGSLLKKEESRFEENNISAYLSFLK